ncbi:phage tail tape measure protein [Pediococcus pentosaceus]|uniref:phage tail tape measure protein n=1 Tax=Pediococcus pentosaceus TaxID=1255 RepID=UPI003F27D357
MSRAKASSNMVFHMEIDDVKFTPTIQEMKRQITLTRKEFDLQIRAAKDLGNEELALTKTIEKHNAVAEKEALMQKRIQEVLDRNKVVTKENMAMVSKATLEQKKAQETEQVAMAQKEKYTKQLTRLQSGVDGLSKSIKEMSDADKLVTERLKAEGKETEAQEQHLKSLDNQRTVTNKLIKQQSKLLHDLGKDSPDYSKEKMALESYKTSLAKLNKEEKKVAEQNAKLNKNLSTYKENISRISGVTNAYVSRLEAEGKQYAANNAKLKGLVQEYSISKKMLSEQVAELGRLKDKYGETSKEYKTQEAEVSKLNSKLGEQAAKYKKLAKSTGGYTATMIAESDRYAKLGKKIGNIGDKFVQTGQSASLFSLGVGAALIKSNKSASELQNTFIKTKNIIQTSGESAKESIAGVTAMQKDAKKYSLEYGESQNNIAKGYEELVKRGYSSKQSLGAMKNELEASKASGDDFSDVLKVTSQTMEAFGMTMDKNGRPLKSTKAMTDRTKDAVNKLAYAADATSANFSDMGVAMSYVGSTAHTAGFSLSETASALGVLSNNGLEADKAGTGLRKVINSLIDPTTNGAKALANLGLSTKDFVDQHGNMKSMSDIMKILNDHTKDLGKNEKGVLFKSLFGVTGMQAGEILANNADNLGKLNDRVKDATKNNYVHNLAKKNMDSFKTQFDRMKAALDNVGISLQKNVMPLLTSMVKWATNLLNKFADMSPKVQKIVTVIAILAAAFAPVTLAVGGILKSLQLVFSVVGKVNGLMGRAKVSGIEEQIATVETLRQKYAEVLALQTEVNGGASSGTTAGKTVTGAEGAVTSATSKTGVVSKKPNLGIASKWKGMGVAGALNIGIAGSEIATSIWGAFTAKSKDAQNQKIWETAATTVGAGIGGIVGGPEGAMWGASIGKAISKNITVKNVKKFLDDDTDGNKPDKAHKNSGSKVTKNMQNAPHDHYDNMSVDEAEWVRQYSKNNDGGRSKKKIQDPLKGLNKATKKEVQGVQKDLKDLVNSYNSSNSKIYKSLNSRVDNEVKKEKAGNKKRLDLLVKTGAMTQQQENKLLAQDNKRTDKKYSKQKTALQKLQKLDEQYSKKGVKKDASYYKQRAKLLDQFNAGESKALSKNSKQQQKIMKQLSDKTTKMTTSRAQSIKKQEDKIYKTTVDNANKARDKAVDAAEDKYKKTVKAAEEEYKNNKDFSKSQYEAVKKAAEDQRDKSEKAAEDQCNAVVSQAKQQHSDVLSEIQQENTDVQGAMGSLSKWYSTHHLFDDIASDANHAMEKITGVKNGMATLEDANAKADLVQRKQAKVSAEKKQGRSLPNLPNDSLSNAFGSHALGGAIDRTQKALVGEFGPEIAFNPLTKKARLLGKRGPELTRVYAGEHILDAKKTAHALKGSFASFANGTEDKEDKYMFGTQSLAKLKQGKNMFVNQKSKDKRNKQSQTLSLNVDKKSQRKFAKSLKDSANKVNKFEKDNKKALTKNDKDTAKLMDKTTKKIEDSYEDMSKNVTKQMNSLKKHVHSSWIDIYKDTKSEMTALYKYTKSEMDAIYSYTTKKESNLEKYISNTNNSIYKTWKKDWSDVSKAFNNEFAKLRNFARNGINGAIDSLNGGVGNINGLIGKFGGNSSILPKINHYATGTDGKIQQDEMALVNDALGSNYKEIVVLPSGKMIMPEERNAVMPLMKGSAVINGNQVANLKNTGRLQAHASGTMDADQVDKIVKAKLKSPQDSWNTDFQNKVTNGIGTKLQTSLTTNNKGSTNKAGVPWYKALWNVISETMGNAAGGPWLHSPGAGWVHTDGFGSSRGGGRVHDGNDFSSGQGAVIHAMHGGRVIYAGGPPAGWKPIGYNIITKGSDGQYVIYQEFGNANNARVSVGDNVKTGQAIATLGHSGLGSGPHVHVGASKNHPHHNGGYTTSGWEDITKMHGTDDGSGTSQTKTAEDKRLEALVKKELGKKAISYISDNWGSEVTGGSYNGGYSVDMIKKAAKAMHVNLSAGELATIKAVIQHESGGSSSVVNNWDSNAKAGHPSKGLLQFIQSTFNAYAVKGHNNILNAYDQLLAMFNDSNWRRDVHTGGWGPTGHRRYANGGFVDHHQLAEVGELNKAEMVLPLTNKNRAYQLIDQAVRYMGDGDSYGNGNNSGTDNSELLDEIKQLRNDTNDLLKLLIQVVKDKPTGYNIRDIQSDLKNVNKFKKTNNAVMTGKV